MLAAWADNYLILERALDRYFGLPLLMAARFLVFSRSRRAVKSSPAVRRVLLIKFHGIGNLFMLVPAVRRIRQHYPDADLHFLTFDTNREALQILKGVDGGYFLERKNLWALLRSCLAFLGQTRKQGYDVIIDFEQFAYFSSILTVLVSSGGLKVGFDNPAHRRASAYSVAVPYVEKAHMTSVFLKLVEATGARIPAARARLTPNPADWTSVLDRLESAGIHDRETLIVMHPGTSRNLLQRRWPPDRFAALADRIVQETGAKVVFSGTAEEHDLVNQIMERMRQPAVNLAGDLSLSAFLALCAAAELVISNDTAAVHVAAAAGTPVAAFYGPNTPFLYGPPESWRNLVFYKALTCSPCLRNTNRKLSGCQNPACLHDITVDEVCRAIVRRYFDATGNILANFKKTRAVHDPLTAYPTVA